MSALLGAKSDAGDILNVNTYFPCLLNWARMEREKIKAFQLFFSRGMQAAGCSGYPWQKQPGPGAAPPSACARGSRVGSAPGCLRDQKPSPGESLPANNSSSPRLGAVHFQRTGLVLKMNTLGW